MTITSSTFLVLALHVSICVPSQISASTLPASPDNVVSSPANPVWQSAKAEHIYGFPELKPHKKGTLAFSDESVTFSGKTGITSIDRNSVTAVSSGNQRVEIWAMKGRLLRMAIPDGGGVAASMFMHHRIDMLTLEYRDRRGAIHGAVFFLPAHQADQAMQSFIQMPVPSRPEVFPDVRTRTALGPVPDCQNPVEARSVLVAAPRWDQPDVPPAYRALVYEHVIDRLRRVQGAGYVYRDGENNAQTACPQYTIHISITAFKNGSQVKRAILGPIGFFVGTTQMTFHTVLNDTSGSVDLHKQVKGTTRGETESTSVADSVAKSLAKQYSSVLKEADCKVVAQTNFGGNR